MFNKIKSYITELSRDNEINSAYMMDGKIYNCKENGIVWLHEYRHLKQFENKKLMKYISFSYSFAPFFFIGAYILKNDLIFIITSFSWLSLMFCLEIDAWIYAFKNFNKLGT